MDPLLTSQQVADLLAVELRTVEDWRARGVGPRFVRVGRRMVRYRPADVESYVAGGQPTSAGEVA